MTQSPCRRCSAADAGEHLTLWDGNVYCRDCIGQASQALLALAESGGALEDAVTFDDIRGIRYVKRMGTFWINVILVMFGLPFGTACFFGKIDGWIVAVVVGGLIAFGLVWFSTQALLAVTMLRSRLPRTLYIADGELRIAFNHQEMSSQLPDCNWHLGNTDNDMLTYFTGLQRGVVICTPVGIYACGHRPHAIEQWQAFLTLARVPTAIPMGCLRMLAIVTAGAVIGALIGVCLGYVITLFNQPRGWLFILGFIGACDGASIGIFRATWGRGTIKGAQSGLQPARIGLPFVAIGLFGGGALGEIPAFFACGAINGLLGALVGWYCQIKLREAQMEQDRAYETGQ